MGGQPPRGLLFHACIYMHVSPDVFMRAYMLRVWTLTMAACARTGAITRGPIQGRPIMHGRLHAMIVDSLSSK